MLESDGGLKSGCSLPDMLGCLCDGIRKVLLDHCGIGEGGDGICMSTWLGCLPVL